jgi:hypothetical protein
MAQILAALPVILEVAGAAITVVPIIASFASSLGTGMLFALKIFADIVIKTLYGIFMLVFLPFSGFFGWIFTNTDDIIYDLRRTQFDPNPPLRNRNIQSIGLVGIAEIAFAELRAIFLDFMVYLSPILAAAWWIGILVIIVIVLIIIGWWATPLVFAGVQIAYTFLIFELNVIAALLNFGSTWVSVVAPIWNPIMTVLYEFGVLVLRAMCSGYPYTGVFSHNCPLLYGFYVFVQTQWSYWWALAQLTWTLLTQLYDVIGGALCPGQCPEQLCLRYLNTRYCYWGPEIIIRVTIGVLADLLIIWLYSTLIMIIFFIQVIQTTISKLGFLLVAILPPELSSYITSVVESLGLNTANLNSLFVPVFMEPEKQMFIVILAVIEKIEDTVAIIFVTVLGLVDGILCNVFRDPWNCAGAKMCFFMFHDVPLFPLRTIFCFATLKLNPYSCAFTCDSCPIQPFGIPLPSAPFFTYANIVHMGPENANAPYAYIPYNMATGCCNTAYTVVQHAITTDTGNTIQPP